MATFPYRSFLPVTDYFELDRSTSDGRYEYIDGIAYMLAGGSLRHSIIGMNIGAALRERLRGGPCRAYSSDARVRLSESRYVYPGVTVSCNELDRDQGDTIRFPRLIVEVLSPNTEGYDRGDKFAFYRECPSLQEYLLINTRYPLIELFRRGKDELWTLHTFGPGDEVHLCSLDLRFPATLVYEDVDFVEIEGEEK